jgi:hypothetical protein
MSDFQILVKNKSGLVRDYILYVQTPNISGTGDVSTSVYMNSNPVPDK